MNLNWLLLWLSGVSCALNLAFVLRRQPSPAWGWRIILSSLLVLLGICWKTIPTMAGYLIGPLWFLFVLLPGLLMRRVNRLLSQHDYRPALWWARVAEWLHPFDGWPEQTELVRAFGLFDRGMTDQASTLITRLGAIDTPLGRTARLIQAQQSGNWQELLTRIDQRYSPARIARNETLMISRLQALGELGRTEEMLLAADLVLEDQDRLPPLSQAILHLRVAALAGQVAATDRQLTTMASVYPEEVRTFWRLTARQVGGEAEVEKEFRLLRDRASLFLQPMIQRRLNQPLSTFDEVAASPQSKKALAKLTASIEQNIQSALWLEDESRRPWATWTIALGLMLNFLREIPGGTLSTANLERLGALVIPQSQTPGEWWRVLTAGFLHFGPLHLGLNLLGLLVFAPRLERVWGRLPMVICYLGTTFTSMALAPYVTQLGEAPFLVLVGASGGVMGLVGGLVGFLFIAWLRHRNEHTRKPLVFLLMIIALQTTFDLNTENVSFACHAIGLTTGIAFGTQWSWFAQRRKDRELGD